MARERMSRTPDEIRASLLERGVIETLDQESITTTETCGRCGGRGWYPTQWHGACFDCGGNPQTYTKVTPVSTLIRREQARDRREYKRRQEAERAEAVRTERLANPDPRIAKLAEVAGFKLGSLPYEGEVDRRYRFALSLVHQWVSRGDLSEKQWPHVERLIDEIPAKDAERAARIEQRRYLGSPGDAVEFAGTVKTARTTESTFGYHTRTSRFLIIETDCGSLVKMFTSAGWAWDIEEGQEVQIKAKVKEHETFNEERQTVVTHPKRVA